MKNSGKIASIGLFALTAGFVQLNTYSSPYPQPLTTRTELSILEVITDIQYFRSSCLQQKAYSRWWAIAHDRSKEFHWKFNRPVAAKMIQLQNPLLRFHKTTKGNFQERIFKSAQRFLFWMILTLWPKSCPICQIPMDDLYRICYTHSFQSSLHLCFFWSFQEHYLEVDDDAVNHLIGWDQMPGATQFCFFLSGG